MSVASERSKTVRFNESPQLKLRIAPEPRRRHAQWLIAGLLLVAVCAFATGQLYLRTTGLRAVLALARNVPAGQTVQAADLRIVDATADGGIALVPSSTESTVLGQPAARDLTAGSLLTQTDLGKVANLAPDQAVVAVDCKPGQYPPALAPGDRVTVVDTGSGGSLQGSTVPPVIATVMSVDVQQGPAADGAIVSIRLPSYDAASVASTATAGRVALVLMPSGS
jgi:SAF domain-containing protein